MRATTRQRAGLGGRDLCSNVGVAPIGGSNITEMGSATANPPAQ